MKNGIVPQPTADPRVFTLPSAPDPPESLQLLLNGILQEPGDDFKLVGDEVHYIREPNGDRQRAYYDDGTKGHN